MFLYNFFLHVKDSSNKRMRRMHPQADSGWTVRWLLVFLEKENGLWAQQAPSQLMGVFIPVYFMSYIALHMPQFHKMNRGVSGCIMGELSAFMLVWQMMLTQSCSSVIATCLLLARCTNDGKAKTENIPMTTEIWMGLPCIMLAEQKQEQPWATGVPMNIHLF